MVEVGGGTGPGHFDGVAADGFGFVVQGLRDVAQEVDEELQGIRVAGLGDDLGVVLDGADDAAAFAAVAGQVDGAGGGGGIFCVDEAN